MLEFPWPGRITMTRYAPRDLRGWKPFRFSVFFLPIYLPFLILAQTFRDCFALLSKAARRWYTGFNPRRLGTLRAVTSVPERK
jgi:hypothetical protein